MTERKSNVMAPLEFSKTIPKEVVDKLEARGIRMRLATSRDIDKVMNHFYEDFMPGEPCSRSLGFVKDGKVEAGKVWRSLNKMFLKPMLSGGTSVIAVNEKDEIVGMKLGRAIALTDKKDPDLPTETMLKHFSKIMSKRMIKFTHLMGAFHDTLRYNPHLAMEDHDIKKIFLGEILAVAGSARGLKLGTALTLQSMELAREKGCEGYLAALTGIYSQKIYSDLGFAFEKELVYAEFKDKDGNVILDDTLEHPSMKTGFQKV